MSMAEDYGWLDPEPDDIYYADRTPINVQSVAHETEKAWLLVVRGEEHWFPKSVVWFEGDEVEVVTDWLEEFKPELLEDDDL